VGEEEGEADEHDDGEEEGEVGHRGDAEGVDSREMERHIHIHIVADVAVVGHHSRHMADDVA